MWLESSTLEFLKVMFVHANSQVYISYLHTWALGCYPGSVNQGKSFSGLPLGGVGDPSSWPPHVEDK